MRASLPGHATIAFTRCPLERDGGSRPVDQDGERGAAVCDVEISAKYLVNAGMTMASKTMGQGFAAVYGRAHDSVTDLYAVIRSGKQVVWPIHCDPRNQERYFAVIADCQEFKDQDS